MTIKEALGTPALSVSTTTESDSFPPSAGQEDRHPYSNPLLTQPGKPLENCTARFYTSEQDKGGIDSRPLKCTSAKCPQVCAYTLHGTASMFIFVSDAQMVTLLLLHICMHIEPDRKLHML